MNNNNIKIVAIALLCSVITLIGYRLLGFGGNDVILREGAYGDKSSVTFANMPASKPGDFTYAAEVASPSVVHITAKSVRQVRQNIPSIFEEFFGPGFGQSGPQQQESSGSGVIISEDGYIATNNHVVEGASQLEVVTFDKKSYKAKVVGVDPSTDIAVIKIETNNLPAILFGNSDIVKVGEWVLAVGNPFNLESTVTAGIISAIGRDINILKGNNQLRMFQEYGDEDNSPRESPIESFIQTDAAVNPGNSGGALVNLNGELIGINTAIASPNGTYAGYAFAVPSGIVKKVTTDLIKFGNVQRGFLGVTGPVELNDKNNKELGTPLTQGIYIHGVSEGGAAKAAGIEPGDVIISLDGTKTVTYSKFMEQLGRKRPGDQVHVVVNRNNSIKEFNVTLKNFSGGTEIVKKTESKNSLGDLGIEVQEISASTKQRLGIRNGIYVSKVHPSGKVANDTEIQKGFIITKVASDRIDSISDLRKAIEKASKDKETGLLICGTYENSSRNFCYGITLD